MLDAFYDFAAHNLNGTYWLHWNMRNADLLQMSGQIGVVAPGAIADLIVVDGDPLEDITCLGKSGTNFPIIMQAGRFYKREL